LKMGDGIGQSEEDYIDEADDIANDINEKLSAIAELNLNFRDRILETQSRFRDFQEGSTAWARELLAKESQPNPNDPKTQIYLTQVNALNKSFRSIREDIYKQYVRDLKKIEENFHFAIQVGLTILVFSAFCTMLALFYTKKYVLNPIRNMAASSLRVIEGQFETTGDVSIQDEIGRLNRNFNSMVIHQKNLTEDFGRSNADLAAKQSEILALNSSLEQRVDAQTRDIRSMLENTKIGLLSVTRDLSIHKDYARYLETILEEHNLAGRSVFDVFLSKTNLGADSVSRLMAGLEYTIGVEDIFFEANESCFPKEVEAEFNGKRKHIDLDWSPVVNRDGMVEKILISLRDSTETIHLRKEAEESRRNVKLLSEVLEIGPSRFTKVMRLFEESMGTLQALTQGRSGLSEIDVRKAFIWLHTMKGNARMFALSELSHSIHSAEEVVRQRKSIDGGDFERLLESLGDISTWLASYWKAFDPILKLSSLLAQPTATLPFAEYSMQGVLQEAGELGDRLCQAIGKAGCFTQITLPPSFEPPLQFVSAMHKALVHLVRNTVDHGLETAEERVLAGKDPKGCIKVYVDEQGRLIYRDDGRGLNLTRIREKAARLGPIPEDPIELVNLIFEPGFSTKDQTTDISGRGVGLDAARSFLLEVGADLGIEAESIQGDVMKFYFVIKVPVEAPSEAKAVG